MGPPQSGVIGGTCWSLMGIDTIDSVRQGNVAIFETGLYPAVKYK